MFLSRDQILNKPDLLTEVVSVPEWGGDVMVKAITGAQRDQYEASLFAGAKNTRNYTNIRAKLVAISIVDEKTEKPLFSLGDIEALGNKSAAGLDKVFTVAQRLSGLTQADVDELAKNSETDQDDSSTTN